MGRHSHCSGQAYQRVQPQLSELDFYSTSSSNTVVGKEVPRIKKLRDAKQLDHYMLFANRRLTGNSETEIRDHIAAECGVPARLSIFAAWNN